MEVVTEKANPLMKRKELVLSIDYTSSTPSRAEMQAAVAQQFSIEPTKVEIKKIMSAYGKASGKVWANVWEEKEIPIYGKKEEPKEEPAPAEAPAEGEPKPEEKPEGPKEEEPKEETPPEEA